jgi:hypothetical protein
MSFVHTTSVRQQGARLVLHARVERFALMRAGADIGHPGRHVEINRSP